LNTAELYISFEFARVAVVINSVKDISKELAIIKAQIEAIVNNKDSDNFPSNYKVNPHYSFGQSMSLIALKVSATN